MRNAIVAEARSWIGTPYHNCADIKGVGVDCGMLLVRVFVDLQLIAPFDPRPYTHDWHMHRGEERYLQSLLAHAMRIDSPRPGDVMLFRVGRCYSHGGIVALCDPLAIVHASFPAKIVLEETVMQNAQMRERAAEAIFASIVGKNA
jgi:NlpC/P60 family putative phage cell wall peptidase